MKVHIDYLENKVENLVEKVNSFDEIQDKVRNKAALATEKFELIKEQKDNVNRKYDVLQKKLKAIEKENRALQEQVEREKDLNMKNIQRLNRTLGGNKTSSNIPKGAGTNLIDNLRANSVKYANNTTKGATNAKYRNTGRSVEEEHIFATSVSLNNPGEDTSSAQMDHLGFPRTQPLTNPAVSTEEDE